MTNKLAYCRGENFYRRSRWIFIVVFALQLIMQPVKNPNISYHEHTWPNVNVIKLFARQWCCCKTPVFVLRKFAKYLWVVYPSGAPSGTRGKVRLQVHISQHERACRRQKTNTRFLAGASVTKKKVYSIDTRRFLQNMNFQLKIERNEKGREKFDSSK